MKDPLVCLSQMAVPKGSGVFQEFARGEGAADTGDAAWDLLAAGESRTAFTITLVWK